MVFYAEILVVDSLPDQVAYLGQMLNAEGYRVFAATSCKATLKLLEHRLPDLVLLDKHLGDEACAEICDKIKERSKVKDMPVIFLTSKSDAETVTQCFKLGAVDYIRKPFLKHEFLARIKTQLKLSIQHRELVAANNELTQFCASVTHDLKAPFTLVNTLVKELQNALIEQYEGELPQKVNMLMGLIGSKTAQAKLMIERLFDFSKMCNVKPTATTVNTKEITEEIFEELMALEKPDRVVNFRCEDLPNIVADETLFRMAMRNLLINALKYSSKKPETNIRVFTEHDTSYYVIKVKDNGAGFDMEYVDRIFNVFERLHTEREFPGTGVGLALVNRIMNRHSGKIEAYGEVDKGAEMTLYFPKNVKIKEIENNK